VDKTDQDTPEALFCYFSFLLLGGAEGVSISSPKQHRCYGDP